ncbi:unnamed protein product, partial [Iphiclides podalirius]
MDSSLRSETQFKSDFSIERILSQDADRVQQDEASPSWLCCTRYRPPRLASDLVSKPTRCTRLGFEVAQEQRATQVARAAPAGTPEFRSPLPRRPHSRPRTSERRTWPRRPCAPSPLRSNSATTELKSGSKIVEPVKEEKNLGPSLRPKP